MVPPEGDAYLCLQRIYSERPACHLDLHTPDVAALEARAADLGASVSAAHEGWAVFRSPGGMAFCTVPFSDKAGRPPPLRWHSGHHSLVGQVCIDIPPDRFADEVRFWHLLTGWERRASTDPEFESLARPMGIPLRLLFQRLDAVNDHADDAASGTVRAHLDLACDNLEAELARHEALGARRVRLVPGWATLADINGMEYCITRRDPVTGA